MRFLDPLLLATTLPINDYRLKTFTANNFIQIYSFFALLEDIISIYLYFSI